jgi:hypothetical protein
VTKSPTAALLGGAAVLVAVAALYDRTRPTAPPAPLAPIPIRTTALRLPLTVQIDVRASGVFPTIEGRTNLPDGTQLVLMLDKPWAPDAEQRVRAGLSACNPECGEWTIKAAVHGGRFSAGPFGVDSPTPLGPGTRDLLISGPLNSDFAEGVVMVGPDVSVSQTPYGDARFVCYHAKLIIGADGSDSLRQVGCE